MPVPVSDDVAKYNKFIDKTLKKRQECCCCPLITCCKNYFCSQSDEQLITIPKVVGRLGSKKHPQQPISRRQKVSERVRPRCRRSTALPRPTSPDPPDPIARSAHRRGLAWGRAEDR